MTSTPNLAVQTSPHPATASTLATSTSLSPNTQQQQQQHQQQQDKLQTEMEVAPLAQVTPLSVREILAHKSTMFNYKLPSDRTMYESSLIYCNLCDFSCDLTDKSAIICHYLAKHPDDNIVYSYLWPQMEQNPVTSTYKVKYYLIKALLKIRTKETQAQVAGNIDLEAVSFPATLLEGADIEEVAMEVSSEEEPAPGQEVDVQFVMNRMLDWCEKNLIPQHVAEAQSEQTQSQEDVQELEEEQEVQEVEMFGEDAYDTTTAISSNQNTVAIPGGSSLDDLVKLSSSASYYYNQQKLMAGGSTASASSSYLLDNNYLVHLLAINKSENAFRVKQIHDYYGGCFICGLQVDFNMKHYQSHFNSEMSTFICLHCNYKEYKQEPLAVAAASDGKHSSKDRSAMPSSSCTGSSTGSSAEGGDHASEFPCISQPYQADTTTLELSPEEKNLQSHMTSCHSMDFDQILEQHQQLQQSASNMNSNNGVVVIESTPMNDMYLTLQIKSVKYIDDDLLRKDEFRADMIYSCPICCADINCFNAAHLNQNMNTESQSAQHYSNYENITFEYLINHFLVQHQLKSIPLFVCTQCNCVRVSLIDAVYHYLRSHFNKPINIGLCAYNIYDKVQNQLNQLNQTSETLHTKSHHRKSAGPTASPAGSAPSQMQLTQIPVAQPSIYGSGPLIYCITCNENYPNEASFIRHSYLSHLLDPNINLNWYKVYTANPNATLQQIATTMAMVDLPGDQTVSIVDQNGNVEEQQRSDLALIYECPLCLKSVQSKDSISRHLLYHAINENFEYEISCSSCTKQLQPSSNLAECLLHTREFRSHRLSVNYHKYVLSQLIESDAQPKPMVACVLCANESENLLSCMSHILLDHFGYDSPTIRIKRFVNYMMNNLKKNDPQPSLPKPLIHSSMKGTSEEIVDYFTESFPSLTNEVITCLIVAATKEASNIQASLDNSESALSAQTHSATALSSAQPANNRPDIFFKDIKCFKCGKFSTKLKQSLFQHLYEAHGYDLKEMDRLYDLLIQRQLQIIDEQQLVNAFEKQQSEIVSHQQVILKEARDKNEQLQKQQQKMIMLTDTSNQQVAVQQQQLQQQQQQQQDMNYMQVQQSTGVDQQQLAHQQAQQQQQQQHVNQQELSTQHQQQQQQQHHGNHGNQQNQLQQQTDNSQIDKIQSTIDQVLLHICKEDYDGGGNNANNANVGQKQEPMMVDASHHQQTNQQQQQVLVQPPEAENLFVFKCNLCEPYSTDDATQLLEHYKLNHQVELTIADSSTLLAAAVAAFQTGHTIEMTGAILNTLSSVTDENGLTIISGEEVPVHTTVQYKCTICQNIFYEKQYIVQHLLEAHNFEIDVSYFEDIEMQQQEQLQQKIYEQQQEQLMMQQQQQQQQQQLEGSQQQQQHQQMLPQQQNDQGNTITDETAAMMMMMMNNGGNNNNQPQQQSQQQPQQAILIQNGQQINGIETAQLIGQDAYNNNQITLNSSNLLTQQQMQQQTQQKQAINYTCTYCNFGADKLPKMSEHLKQSHAYREKTCMDNVRQQMIRLPNENMNSNYQTNSNLISQQQHPMQTAQPIGLSGSQTVAANLALSRQQQQQQLQKSNNSSTIIDNLSSSLINLTSSIAAHNALQPQDTSKQHINQIPTNVNHSPASNGRGRRSTKASMKQQNNQHRSGSSNTTIANVLKQQQQQQLALQQQQQQQQQQLAQSNIKTPTILTMDANSQIIIDFNQNDDLLCSYCDYTINNLNYMRTHIKIKHKNLAITFQNKVTYKFYTIVEWPLTSVPTLTPANQAGDGAAKQESTQSQQQQVQQPQQQTQIQQQQILQQSTEISQIDQSIKQVESKQTTDLVSAVSSAASINESISSTIRQKLQQQQTQSSNPPATPGVGGAASASDTNTTTSTSASTSATASSKASNSATNASTTESSNPSTPQSASGATSASGGVNINSVNTILKKLGVNVSTASSPLSSLISSIGTGNVKHTSNNSVVNINLNVLKDVNIDEMIDDDDDEERKFLIKELEKKANNKKGIVNGGGTGDYGSDSGSTTGGVKRSRSNSSSLVRANPLSPTQMQASQSALLSQLNITLNCHYCWAQFQLNVSKNLKNNVQQKENGKYMQHLAMHLNAPYKCNECSYPIMDTKTFYKHKQFYKHDEKTCIMVDNDINLPTTGNTADSKQASSTSSTPRRKTLIATRLKQHQANLKSQELENPSSTATPTDLVALATNEIQLVHDRDSFKCALCYGDDDYAPTTSVSTLNKQPTHSNSGASNFSFDKEQVLKHVLIVHLSFLAYKCDTCTQFYAFDEPQTKQHAALVHQCGTGQLSIAGNTSTTDSTPAQPQTCHFKLIKTEEEINLAINKAQQFINKLPASAGLPKSIKGAGGDGQKVTKAAGAASLANVTIEAEPKYKCCRCVQTPAVVGSPAFQPIVLYTYQDALDHVMQVHMSGGSATATASNVQSKKDKKLNYELELFEQNLEDLLASETGQTTTITVGSSTTKSTVNPAVGTDLDDCYSDDDLEGGDFGYDDYFNDDLSEWNVILNEPFNMHQTNVLTSTLSNTTNQSPNTLAANRKQKRFKTNNNTFITTSATSPTSLSDTENNIGNTSLVKANASSSVVAKQPQQMSRRFYFKPHLVYKCQLCTRKFHQFDYNHWLQHDLENHHALYKSQEQQFTCFKCTSCNAGTAQKVFSNFTQFLEHYKQEHLNASQQQKTVTASTDVALADGTVATSEADQKLINCLVCGAELKCTYVDMLKHFQSEHELNLFDLKLNLTDLELIHTLQIHNQVHLSQSVRLRRRCFIRIPPQVINPSVPSEQTLTKSDLIDKELKLLNEIYKEQIVEKQIVSWLNSEQFLRRNFNYNSYVCIICNATKSQILETHYHANKIQSASTTTAATGNTTGALVPASEANPAASASTRHQFYSDEMKTVVLTNHILSHFNEYCYRCMSCKISWPDRTQLLKHAQECSNSQVVRTKTKYKLKANCRLQLKFYLQTYLDYWQYEKCLESKSVEQLNSLNNMSLVPAVAPPSTKLLDCKVFLSDVIENKDLLLSASKRSNLNAICLMDGQKLLVKDDEEEGQIQAEVVSEKVEDVSNVEAVEAEGDEIKSEDEKPESAVAAVAEAVVEKVEESTDVVMKDEAEEMDAVQTEAPTETTTETKLEEETKEFTTAKQPATADEAAATATEEKPQTTKTTTEKEVK